MPGAGAAETGNLEIGAEAEVVAKEWLQFASSATLIHYACMMHSKHKHELECAWACAGPAAPGLCVSWESRYFAQVEDAAGRSACSQRRAPAQQDCLLIVLVLQHHKCQMTSWTKELV